MRKLSNPLNLGYRKFVKHTCNQGACKGWTIVGNWGLTTDDKGNSTFYIKAETSISGVVFDGEKALIISEDTDPNLLEISVKYGLAGVLIKD